LRIDKIKNGVSFVPVFLTQCTINKTYFPNTQAKFYIVSAFSSFVTYLRNVPDLGD